MLGNLFNRKPKTAYQAIGGEKGTLLLANTFYDIMQTDPFAKELLAIHPQPMDKIREKFFEFLSGWLGGPGLFEEKYGHPMLRARHLPFKVDDQMIEQWLYCMNKALDQTVKHDEAREAIREPITKLAHHMKNTDTCPVSHG
ncbi:group II truncated hemoglobin [Marinifaba aquimaris]|uniref:group II truncated hemoglobin n=1 Tax=Marinifaba aquimaris TaxID=2741323 RepID=UPI0031B62A72